MNKRYRLVHGETHSELMIADDEERKYLHGFQVDRLNEYDEKCRIMNEKLEELGFKLVCVQEKYNMETKRVEVTYSKDADYINADCTWIVISIEEFNRM